MSTFDPSTLISLLQKGAGVSAPDDLSGSNKFATFPSSNNSTPDTPAPSTPPPPSPTPPTPDSMASLNTPPQQNQRLQGIKGYLSNILHGVGEGMKANLGMETDAQQQARVFKQNLDTQKLQNEQLNTESEIKFRSSQIQDAQLRLKQQQTAADYSRFDFQKDPISGKISVFDKSKAIDLLKQGKDPSTAFTTYDSRGGGSGASIDSIDKQILSQAGIDPNGLSPQEKAAHAAALFEAKLKGDPKPLLDWTNNSANRSIRLSPTVTNTTETKELADGSLVQIPKTSTSQKIGALIPGAAPASSPKAPISLNTRGGVKTLVGADGQPLQGKTAADTVYATDPKTGQTIFTNRADASAQGLTDLQKVTPVQRRKDEALSNRLADVQRKVGDYAETFDQPIDAQDQQAIAYLMDNNIGGGLHAGGLQVSILPQYVQSQLKARGMQALSDAGMKRFILFNQARESLSGYQQILTNSSRSSDKVLELQLEQLPPPLADKPYADMTTGQFQQNLDLAGQHMPIFPGSAENQQTIKAEQAKRRAQTAAIQSNQAKGASIPPRPANVPGNYIYKVNGPKGTGWYRP